MAPSPDDAPIMPSERRVAIAVDSCSLLDPAFLSEHHVPVAQMRINIGDESSTDNSRIDYAEMYRRVAQEPETRAWVSAPIPQQWLETIKNASQDFDAVICLTVAAGLSASYDSARVAADLARKENDNLDIRVVDSGTISGALKLLATEATRVADLGFDANEVIEHIQQTKSELRTIATLDNLNRIHHIANAPKILIRLAKTLNIKPVVSFSNDEFHIVAKPFSIQDAIRRMIRAIADDIETSTATFVVLHADAPDRAKSVAKQISTLFKTEYVSISDFHPFTGFYAGRGAIGIAWHDQSHSKT